MGCGSSKDVVEGSSRKHQQEIPKQDETTIKNENNNIVNKETLLNAEKKEPKTGDRVHVRGYVGTVKFNGPTRLGEGKWIGIELDKAHPQGNNGAFENTEYFACKPKHGLLVRPEVVCFHTDEFENGNISNISSETVVRIQYTMRRFLAKIRLAKLQERSGNEKKIDKHVMNTTIEEKQSINRLTAYLTEPFTSSRDKAFAIYRWLTFNVAYDVDGYFGRTSKRSCKADDVLKSGLSVCAGYSNLFEAMGKAAGLEIYVVSGYAKGYGHQPGQRVQGTNHAWNALCIDGQWYLSDATWGAGYVGNDMMFHRESNTYRFLMDPEYAIFDHLPEDDKWQFLDEPVSKETFANAAVMSGPMFLMGVEFISHKEIHHKVDGDSIEMTFYCPGKKINLMGKVKNSSGQVLQGREWSQFRPCGINQVKMRAQFPAPGTYNVDIYINVEGSWTQGTSYIVTATKGCGEEKGGFPQLSGSFYENGFDLLSPLENIETNSGKTEVRLECYSKRFSTIFGNVVGVNESAKHLVKNQALCFTEKTNDGFVLKVDTPAPGTYMLNIFAKEEAKDSKSRYLCKYYITNTEHERRPVVGFPRLSDDFHSWRLELIGPRENIISADGKPTIQIKLAEGMNKSLISVSCNLQPSDGTAIQLQPNQQLCFYEKTEDMLTVKTELPKPGLYTLNIFGTRGDSESKKQTWLCTYHICSTFKPERAVLGFPRRSDDFLSWGLEIDEPRDNIHSHNGTAQISIKCTENIHFICNLSKDKETFHGSCTVTANNNKKLMIISIKLPSEGLFTLNIFGKRENEDKNSYLLSYIIKSDQGCSE